MRANRTRSQRTVIFTGGSAGVGRMRVRANITGAEQRAIVEFLKSSSH